jgi:protein gp37
MGKSRIEWTDHTWNPVTGCTPISEGCQNCWAKRMSARLAGRYGYPKDDPFRVTFHHDKLSEPMHWRKPQKVFVCSMGDLFHDDVTDEDLLQVFNMMREANRHTYMILTKRPERMKDFCSRLRFDHNDAGRVFLSNKPDDWINDSSLPLMPLLRWVWLGVTAENQARADERIPILLQIPAAVRFVSVEPMLGPVDLEKTPAGDILCRCDGCMRVTRDTRLDWVIAGPETGPHARPCKREWVAGLYEQCRAAGVPLFDKRDILGKRIREWPEVKA